MRKPLKLFLLALTVVLAAACSRNGAQHNQSSPADELKNRSTIWDLLSTPDANTNIRVNKYIWNAALETLNFLPLEAADPFSGVMVMGWGRAPGSAQPYRATIYIQDPALDARSLRISLLRRSGSGSSPASAETVRQVEDAILTRARQLRQADASL